MTGRPLDYTTQIPARRTAAECLELLMDAGADEVRIKSAGGQVAAIGFELDTAAGRRAFVLPVNVEGMQAYLTKASRSGKLASRSVSRARLESREHAANVAWRVLKDWLEAQLARVAAEQAALDQVLLGYMVAGPGQTVYDRYVEQHGRLELGPPD